MADCRFDGRWRSQDGEHVCDISGSEIQFADGTTTQLMPYAKSEYCIELTGQTYVANVSVVGRIKWSDGDVWMLDKVEPVDERHATAAKIETEDYYSCIMTEARELQIETKQRRRSSRTEVIVSSTEVSPLPPSAIFNEIEHEGGLCEYRVLQGPVYKKVGEDPLTEKGRKKTQPVGSTLRCTGRRWRGVNDSQWVELDNPELPGWVLVEGAHVAPGPLLEKVIDGEEAPIVLKVADPRTDGDDNSSSEREVCIRPSGSIRELKGWIAMYFNLKAGQINICKPQSQRPSDGKFVVWHNLGNDEFVEDGSSIKEAGFKHRDTIAYIYMGYIDSIE